MFVVKKPVTITKTIRLPEELIKRLELVATDKDISLNQLIVQCCDYALKYLADEEEINNND
ncbi:YlcI/YnfO family protein [Eubacteriaceae bacterium ES2]|nr:YlcI/YnfO family protein [Eubacteriaceae bacterium ES2]